MSILNNNISIIHYSIILKIAIKSFDLSISNIRSSIDNISDLKYKIIKDIYKLLKTSISIYNDLNKELNELLNNEPRLRNELDEICYDVENSKHLNSNSTEFLSSRRSQVWTSIEILISKRNSINSNITQIVNKGRTLWSLYLFYKNMETSNINLIEDITDIPNEIEQAIALIELPSKSDDLFIHFCKVTWEIGVTLSQELNNYQRNIMDTLEAREESIQLIDLGNISVFDNTNEIYNFATNYNLIKEKKLQCRFYELCFLGSEFVTFISKFFAMSRNEAVILGKLLNSDQNIYDIRDKTLSFEDSYERLYRFKVDYLKTRKQKSGYLYKKGKLKFRLMYFIWDAEQLILSMYRSKDDLEPISNFNLSELYAIRNLESQNVSFAFEIVFSGDVLLLAAGSDRDRKDWVRILLFSFCQCGKHLPSVPPRIISWVNRLSVDAYNSLNISLLVRNDISDFSNSLINSNSNSLFSPVSYISTFNESLYLSNSNPNNYESTSFLSPLAHFEDSSKFVPTLGLIEENSLASCSNNQYTTPSKSKNSSSPIALIELEIITEFAQHRLKWAKLVTSISEFPFESNTHIKLLLKRVDDLEKSLDLLEVPEEILYTSQVFDMASDEEDFLFSPKIDHEFNDCFDDYDADDIPVLASKNSSQSQIVSHLFESWNTLIKPVLREPKDIDPILELSEVEAGSFTSPILSTLSPIFSSIPMSPTFKLPAVKPGLVDIKDEIISILLNIMASKDFCLNELIDTYSDSLSNLFLPFLNFLFLNNPDFFLDFEFLSSLNCPIDSFLSLSALDIDDLCDIFIDKIVTDIQSFHAHMLRFFRQLIPKTSNLQISKLFLGAIHRHIFSKLYKFLHPLVSYKHRLESSQLKLKVQELSEITLHELGLDEELCLEETGSYHGYNAAIELYKDISNFLSPIDKLTHICDVAQKICSCVDEFRHIKNGSLKKGKEAVIGADDLLLLFVLLVIRGNVNDIYPQLKFMDYFLNEETRATSEGYYHATLQASVELVRTIEKDKIIQSRDVTFEN